jgi:hypothetical protein
MLTEDFIRRQIALASAILAHILGLKQAGQYDQAMQSVEQAIEQLTGLRSEILLQLDDQGFIDLLARKQVQDVERLQLLAGLYQQAGEIQTERSQEQTAGLYFQRALLLNLEIAQASEELPAPESQAAIAELRRKLEGIDLSFETRLALLNYDELLQAGRDG